ncbi:MAG: protein-L-isoaspartate O-methyltransferase, partial [Proteobacteria bacterium]|nr:protein-L-isoaspartate O-methyltransferase [Pseudomonadota bacterium]
MVPRPLQGAEQARKIRLIMHLRNMGIVDTRVLAAMEKVPREDFVPAAMADQAYEDIALPIGRGQTISQPYVVAAMTQALQLGDKKEKVLEIGTGSGYQTCILAHLCRRVYTIERHKPLLMQAEKMFDRLKLRNITAIAGD